MKKNKEVPNNILFCDNIKLSKDKNIRNNQLCGGGLPYILRNNGVDVRDFRFEAQQITRDTDRSFQTDLNSRW